MFKIIEIQSSLGAPDTKCGMEKGPETIVKLLHKESIVVKVPNPQHSCYEEIHNLSSLVILNKEIKNTVGDLLRLNYKPLILAGDCSSTIGAVYAVLNKYKDVGIIWFDAHGDFNTPSISPSGCLYGMGLAHVAGFGSEALINLSNIYIDPKNIVMIGQRKLDIQEKKLINKLGMMIYSSVGEDTYNGLQSLKDKHIDNLYLHFDMDVIDKKFDPAVLLPTGDGLNHAELLKIGIYLKNNFNIVGISISNYVPSKDKNAEFAKYIVTLIKSLIG